MLNYLKLKPLWIILAAVAVVCAAAACFVIFPVNRTLDDETEARLHRFILEYGESPSASGSFPVEDHIVLKAEKRGGRAVIYAIVYYGEYRLTDKGIEEGTAWHVPAVITLDLDENGGGTFRDPEDGTYFVPSIRRLFPFYLWDEAINTPEYAGEQIARAREQAERYFLNNEPAG